MRRRRRTFWLVGGAIALLLFVGAIALWVRSKPTAEVEFVPVEAIFKDPNTLGQLRVVLASFVRRGTVNAMLEVVAIDSLNSGAHTLFMRKERSASTNGISAWLLKDDDLSALSKAIEFKGKELLARPRIITHEGMMGAFSSSSSVTIGRTNYDAGLEVRIIARRAGEKTDLLLGIRDTDFAHAAGGGIPNARIHTNAYFALRVQLPPQERAMILVEREKGKPQLLISVQADIQ